MKSKRSTLSLLTAVGTLVLLGTVACKQSETTDGTLSAPGSQIPRDSERTVPGTRPGQAPDMPQSPNSQ
jgi:hypothetical protein